MALTLNDLQNYAYWNNDQGREKDRQQNRADYFLVSPQYEKFITRKSLIEAEVKRIEKTVIAPSDEVNALLTSLSSAPLTTGIKLGELLRRPEITYAALEPIDKDRPSLQRSVRVTSEILIKYDGYIKRELAEVERKRKLEDKAIPENIDYKAIVGLRLEAAEKLDKIRPKNIGQASRISGVNPADINVLIIYLSQKRGK